MAHANPFQFDASLPASGTWPMPANMSSLGAELLAVMLNHATAASPRLTELKHASPTFAFGNSGRECMDCVLSEVANKRFEIPFEGGTRAVRMMEAVVINPDRLGFEIGEEYAEYLRSVATPEPPALKVPGNVESFFLTADERVQLRTALQLLYEIRTVVWNFAAVEAARDKRQVPAAGAFGLTEIHQVLTKLGGSVGGFGMP
jgi:hypothetical protein